MKLRKKPDEEIPTATNGTTIVPGRHAVRSKASQPAIPVQSGGAAVAVAAAFYAWCL